MAQELDFGDEKLTANQKDIVINNWRLKMLMDINIIGMAIIGIALIVWFIFKK